VNVLAWIVLECRSAEDRPVNKKYLVELTEEEREALRALTSRGTTGVRRYKRARALLAAAAGETDAAIAEKVGLHPVSLERLRKRFVEEGLEVALAERPRPGARRALDGRQEAHLVALACTTPPRGQHRWTMQLLADRLVELRVVDRISDETVRRTLKRGI
jgi:transposase